MKTIKTETGYQLDNIQVDAKPFSRLPTQQARALLYIAKGLPQKVIAKEMGIQLTTVKQMCNTISFKLHTSSMRETVHHAMQQGILRYTLCLVLCVLSAANSDLDRSFRVSRVNRTTRTTRVKRLRELQNDFLTA